MYCGGKLMDLYMDWYSVAEVTKLLASSTPISLFAQATAGHTCPEREGSPGLCFAFPHKGSAAIDCYSGLGYVKYDTLLLSSVTLCSCFGARVCTEKPDFQQGQQQTDVLEALLLQR
jgi:hypothetical protein